MRNKPIKTYADLQEEKQWIKQQIMQKEADIRSHFVELKRLPQTIVQEQKLQNKERILIGIKVAWSAFRMIQKMRAARKNRAL